MVGTARSSSLKPKVTKFSIIVEQHRRLDQITKSSGDQRRCAADGYGIWDGYQEIEGCYYRSTTSRWRGHTSMSALRRGLLRAEASMAVLLPLSSSASAWGDCCLQRISSFGKKERRSECSRGGGGGAERERR